MQKLKPEHLSTDYSDYQQILEGTFTSSKVSIVFALFFHQKLIF